MNSAVLTVVFSQLLFTTSDIMARYYMPKHGFKLATFLSLWFLAYCLIRLVATVAQLYVLTSYDLSKTFTLFGAVSLIIANLAGVLLFKELISPAGYVAMLLAVTAFLLLAFKG